MQWTYFPSSIILIQIKTHETMYKTIKRRLKIGGKKTNHVGTWGHKELHCGEMPGSFCFALQSPVSVTEF